MCLTLQQCCHWHGYYWNRPWDVSARSFFKVPVSLYPCQHLLFSVLLFWSPQGACRVLFPWEVIARDWISATCIGSMQSFFFFNIRELEVWVKVFVFVFCFLLIVFIHLAALGLSCGTSGRRSSVFVAACGIFSYSMWTLSCGVWDLVPWPGMEPGASALGAWSFSNWTTREVLVVFFSFNHCRPNGCEMVYFPILVTFPHGVLIGHLYIFKKYLPKSFFNLLIWLAF